MCRLSLNLGASASWNPLGLWRPSPGLFCLIYSIKERWVWRTWKQIWGRTVRTGAGELSVTYLLTYTKEQSPSWECNRFCSWSRNSPHFMESEGSLPHSQVSAICPYPGPVRSTTRGDASCFPSPTGIQNIHRQSHKSRISLPQHVRTVSWAQSAPHSTGGDCFSPTEKRPAPDSHISPPEVSLLRMTGSVVLT